MFDLDKITWLCHVCRAERPDRLISVHKSTRLVDGMVVHQGIRFCNDNYDCATGALVIDLTKQQFNKETEVPDTDSHKYVTFNRDDFERHLKTGTKPSEIEDAVVIRRQDQFAPTALSAYAMNIAMAAKLLLDHDHPEGKQLQQVADYFSGQADLAAEEAYKLPD